MPEYEVDLRNGETTRKEVVVAQTPHLAVKLAERINEGMTAERLTSSWLIIGPCYFCGVVLFEGQGRVKERRGKLYCGECKSH